MPVLFKPLVKFAVWALCGTSLLQVLWPLDAVAAVELPSSAYWGLPGLTLPSNWVVVVVLLVSCPTVVAAGVDVASLLPPGRDVEEPWGWGTERISIVGACCCGLLRCCL